MSMLISKRRAPSAVGVELKTEESPMLNDSAVLFFLTVVRIISIYLGPLSTQTALTCKLSKTFLPVRREA